MNKLLVLCCLLAGSRVLAQTPLELNLMIRLADLTRNIPARCVEHSVTPVSCSGLSNTDALVPHPDDCQLFYYCEAEGAAPTCRQCPAGLHFNPTLHVCDWPPSAGCNAHAPTTTTSAPIPDSPNNTTPPIFNSTTASAITNLTTTSAPNATQPWITTSPYTSDGPPSNSTTIATASTVTSNDTWPSRPSNTTSAPNSSSTTWSSSDNTNNWLSNDTRSSQTSNTTSAPNSNTSTRSSSKIFSTATLPSSTNTPASNSSTSRAVPPITQSPPRTSRPPAPSSTTGAPTTSAPTVRTSRHSTVGWRTLN